ncbi:MAG: imidazolonepropionase [Euryarchaeota archaeon]|nr:imidazolonepropionase [Euryarchaeota archaeon]
MKKIECDTLLKNIGQLATMRGGLRKGKAMGDAGIVKDGAIAIKGGKILWAGAPNGASKFDAQQVVDAGGLLVVPGFVDAHTHLVFAGSREFELPMKLKGMSYMDIMEAGGGIGHTMERTRKASYGQLVAESSARAQRMLEHGTTTLEAKSGYCLETKGELRMLQASIETGKLVGIDVVPTFLGAHAVPLEFRGADAYTKHLLDEMIPAVAKAKAAKYCDVFCEEGVFGVAQSEKILKAAAKKGMKSKLHADEVVALGGGRLAAKLGATSADHLLMTPKKDFKAMAKANVIGVMLPGTPYVLMQDRYADARGMMAAGMALALATDLNPNCWLESMQMAISLACYKMRMTPAEALCAATINAAHAIGMGDIVGSIEPGKRADLVVMGARTIEEIPYRWGSNLALEVWKRGKCVAARE